MEKKFRIALPDNPISEETNQAIVRAFFKKDVEDDGGFLTKTFVFLYLNQPVTVTLLTDKINEYFHTDEDRIKTSRALKKLESKNIVGSIFAQETLIKKPTDLTDIDKEIMQKYLQFIASLPSNLKQTYESVKYYWVSNGEGIKYIEWCCDLLGFPCEQKIKEG